jgi:hypothetical protein
MRLYSVAAELLVASLGGTCFRKIGAMGLLSRRTVAHLGHRQHFGSGLFGGQGREQQSTPRIKQIAKLTTAVVLAAIAIALCAYAFILMKQ